MVKMRLFVGIAVVFIVMSALSVACGTSDESTVEPADSILEDTTAPEAQVITIGNLTDRTGPAASAMEVMNTCLEDIVEYYNRENEIPGVELRVVHYDGQYDPAKDVPGYQRLKQEGADVIFTAVASSVVTLQPRLEKDDFVIFTVAPNREAIKPNGYVFVPGSPLSEDLGYSLLKWVADNDPDFPKDRPAKVGGAFWAEAYGSQILEGAKSYANAHPDQYRWEEGYLVDFSFNWSAQVEGLRNCDYVIPPVPLNAFVEQYRNAGGGATFIGTHAHDAFIYQIDRANLWEEVDGMYFLRASEWWTDEDSSMVDLMKKLLVENHPGRVDEIKRAGNGYLTGYNYNVMLQMIKGAVETGGSGSFDTKALFDAADSFSMTIDGIERESLSGGERISINYLMMYELRADGKDLFRVEPKWNPVVSAPYD